jgi:RHS repeat-associated protein
MGRRIYKSSSSGTSIYAYDDFNLIEETNGSGTAVARYAQTEQVDEPLAVVRSSLTSYFEADGLRSITSLSSATGALVQTYTFDSFGKQTASSGSLTNAAQFTGREFDAETNLYFYRARYYDQNAGRFLSEDPIRMSGGSLNFYSYVNNNPTVWTDPSGKTRIHGNWCGPNWTGGVREPYNPDHVLSYKDPVDYVDGVCKDHDICYYNCRKNHPCSREDRRHCMRMCDYDLSGSLNAGVTNHKIGPFNFWSWTIDLGIMLGNFSPDEGRNAGPSQCSNCNK